MLYNDFLNDFQFVRLEEQGYRVKYAPLSEMMWLFWYDYAKLNSHVEKHVERISRFLEMIRTVVAELNSESTFEQDPITLVALADQHIGYYIMQEGSVGIVGQRR